jgi:hypothetical protein
VFCWRGYVVGSVAIDAGCWLVKLVTCDGGPGWLDGCVTGASVED